MKVYLVASTEFDWEEVYRYLRDIRGDSWSPNSESDAEQLIEFMGRLCYRSWAPGLNPNVTKVRADSGEYLANIIRSGHGSVLEHAWASFVFADVSRVFTHELVRHRVGTAISQESLRFVRVDELDLPVPTIIQENESALHAYYAAEAKIEEAYQELLHRLGVVDMATFAEKKVATSAARRVLPMGLPTTIGWSVNLRTLRHVLESRTSPHAEEEIRQVFDRVGQIAKEKWPLVFADFERQDDGAWVPRTSKV